MRGKTREINIGDIFGSLVVIAETTPNITPNGTVFQKYICRCNDCGKEDVYLKTRLINGTCQCSCKGRKIVRDLVDTKLRNSLNHAISRCDNPKDPRYHVYGARGITVCDEWRNDYSVFKEWAMNNGFETSLTLDRINTDGNYCPENCRWVSQKVQQNNRSNNKLITYKGRTQTTAQWAQELGINKTTLCKRIQRGLEGDELFSTKRVNSK